MREGRFWRVLPADVRLPPLLTTAELMQYHIKSVNGLYQCQDPLIDNSRQHKASERRRLHTQICSAQLLVVISGGETRERRCEFILYTLWITWVFTAWLIEHMCFYMFYFIVFMNINSAEKQSVCHKWAEIWTSCCSFSSRPPADVLRQSAGQSPRTSLDFYISIFFQSNIFWRQILNINIIYVIIINLTLQVTRRIRTKVTHFLESIVSTNKHSNRLVSDPLISTTDKWTVIHNNVS